MSPPAFNLLPSCKPTLVIGCVEMGLLDGRSLGLALGTSQERVKTAGWSIEAFT